MVEVHLFVDVLCCSSCSLLCGDWRECIEKQCIYIYIYILKSKEQLSWTIKEFLAILLSRMSDNKYIYSKLNSDHRSMSGLGNFNGPFGLKGEWGKVKGNRVELAKNKLILDQFYFILLSLNPNRP